MRRIALLLVLALSVVLSACGANVNIQRDAAGNLLVTAELNESTVNDIIRAGLGTVSVNGVQLFSSITSVDMQPGKIVVSGTRSVNGQTVNGTLELGLSASNGSIAVQVLALNVNGVSSDATLVQNINNALATRFANRAQDTRRGSITGVQISDTSLKITVTVPQQ